MGRAMLATALSASIVGVDGVPVRVEVDVAFGLPGLTIVGLAGSAVLEARERVRAAVRNSGFEVPPRRITINLAPADLPKEGTVHDVAMAIGLLVASEQLAGDRLARTALMGELALDGSLRPVPGVLALVSAARVAGATEALVPARERRRGGRRDGHRRSPHADAAQRGPPPGRESSASGPHRRLRPWFRIPPPTMRPISARSSASRSLAAPSRSRSPAGTTSRSAGHPGSERRCWREPRQGCCHRSTRMRRSRWRASTRWPAWSRSGMGPGGRRPFRAPHHTVSTQALVGGGPRIRPGEASLAHRGALFLDETLQFRADALDALRGPIDAGAVSIARVDGVLSLPARFMLLAAFNPCPCGWWGVDGRECRCEDGTRRRYQARLSGPMRDRLDFVIRLDPAIRGETTRRPERDAPRSPRACVCAWEVQRRRQGRANAEIAPSQIGGGLGFDRALMALLDQRGRQLALSLRRVHRAARVARTIADLDGSARVLPQHLDEALCYRPMEAAA